MEATRQSLAKYFRLALALGYASLVVWLAQKTDIAGPVLMIALGLPLVFRFVPRNWLYGTRTLRTLRGSEETWYRQNVITGVVMVLVGVVWSVVRATR
jgi:hypothetical protein